MENFDLSKIEDQEIEDSESVDSDFIGRNKYSELSKKAKLLEEKYKKLTDVTFYTGGELKMTEAEREKRITLTATPGEIEKVKQEITDLVSLGFEDLANLARGIIPLTEEEFQQAAKQGVFKLLRDEGEVITALDVMRALKISISPQEIIDTVPYVKAVLGEIQKISPDLYYQLLNSQSSLIGLCNGARGPLIKTEKYTSSMGFSKEENRKIILDALKQVAVATESRKDLLKEEELITETPERNYMTEKTKEKFQAFVAELPTNDGFIDFNQLQRKGGGGTHDVFVYPKNKSFVIKLNRGVLEKSLSVGQSVLSPEMRQKAEQYVDNENQKNKQLYQYFGQEHCLRDEVTIQKISIENEGIIKNIESPVIIQEASIIFQDPNRKDLSTDYVEKNLSEHDGEAYYKMNQALFERGRANEKYFEKHFLKLNDKFRPTFELIDKDKNFADSVRDFLFKFKKYFKVSDRFIDLVGQDNVVFFQKDGNWSFVLKSVLKDETKQNMEEALRILEEDPNQLNSDDKKRNNLMNSLTFSRVLNALGLKTRIGKIVDIKLTPWQFLNLNKIKF